MSRTQPELSVEMWYCGDDECACERPQVVVRYPFDKPWPGVGVLELIEEGPFYSFGYGDYGNKERAEQKRWLRKAEDWYRTRHVCGPKCAPPTPSQSQSEPTKGEEE